MTPARSIGPLFFGSEIYRGSSYGGAHPLRIPRVSTVMDLCRALGWFFAPGAYRTAPCAKPEALQIWHDPAYLAALQAAERDGTVTDDIRHRHHLGTLSNPVFPQMYRRPATGAGGAMLAAELLARADAGAVFVPGGGTHHGMADRANGFCYLNDPVLAILTLQRAGMRRVAYVDIDAHHCDGVAHGFAADPSVLMISVHEESRWPFTGALDEVGIGNMVNLPVPRGFNDSEMRAVTDRVIVPHLVGFRPDALVLQCGADGLAEDPLSRLALSNNAHRAVLAAVRTLAPRLLVLGGGGYNPWTVGRLWSLIWADLAGKIVPDILPPDAQAILRALGWNGGGRPPPEPHLLTTLADPPRAGPVRAEITARIDHLLRHPARAFIAT
jgi:acetoin utilization protein AcuC